tara:strand:+ start:558 stop:1049 length:492 start_codon:yes stop_codon:yes gene_type:complete
MATRYKSKSKTKSSKSATKTVVKSLYDGFTKIAEKKIKELTSKTLTDEAKKESNKKELSVNNIANSSRGEKEVIRVGVDRVSKQNVKNFFKNIDKNGRRSNKAFTTNDIFVKNLYPQDSSATNVLSAKIPASDTAIGKLTKRRSIRRKIRLSDKVKTQPINQK